MLFTQKEALEEIFYNNKKALSPKLYVYKSRLKKGSLSQKTIDNILAEHGYSMEVSALYKKQQ